MKKFLFISCIVLTSLTYSQVIEVEQELKNKVKTDTLKGWKQGGVFNLGFSQTSFTNWAAGGQNSIAGNAMFSTFSNYKSPNSAWDNQLDMGYGILKQGDDGNYVKTDDKIDLTSKYGYKASNRLYYAILGNFKTQSTVGYKNPDDSIKVSDFLSPAYFLLAIGIDYRPNDKFTAFFAPITQKTTIVNSAFLANQGAYGVDAAFINDVGEFVAGKKLRTEFGGYLRVSYKEKFYENISLQTKIDFFSNYLEKPQNIDVNWEMIIAFKIAKYFSVNISTHLIYDDDIKIDIDSNNDGIIDARGPRIQFKEVMTIGFSYSF